MYHFLLDVGELRVEFVLFCGSSGNQPNISHDLALLDWPWTDDRPPYQSRLPIIPEMAPGICVLVSTYHTLLNSGNSSTWHRNCSC